MPSNGRPRALFENTTSDDESDEWNRLQTKINARRQQQQQQRQPHSDCSVSSKNSSSSGSSSGSSSSGCNNKNKKEDKGGGCVTGKISIGNAPQIVEHQNQQQQRSMEQQHSVVPSTIVVVAQHQPSAPQNTGAPPPRPPSIAAAVSTLAVATSAKITAITTSAPPPIRSEHPSGASRNCSNVVRTANHHPTPGGFCNTAPSSNNTLGTDANRDDDEEEDNNSAFDTELAAIPFLPPTTHASIQDKNPPRSIPRSAPPSSEAGPDPFLDDSSFQFPGFTEEDLAAMEIPENISMKNEAIIAFPASKPSADGRVQKKGAARSAFFATKSRANSPPVRQEEVLNEKDPLESYPSYAIGSGSRPENIQRDAMITSCSGTSKNNTSHDGAYLQCNSDGAHPIEVHDDTCACEYEVASKSDDWYTEDLLLPGIVNPSQDTQRRSNTSNVDAFGFEIESAPSNPTVNGDWMPARPEDMREIKESGPREHDALTETVSSVVPLFDHAFDVDVAFGFQSDPPDDGIIPTKDFVTNQSFEVNPSHFSSTPWDVAIEPIVHNFTTRNRPSAVRKHIPVTDVFDAPVANFWKTKFQTFNQLQSEMVNMLAYSDDHVVVGAPTGAGKTAVFEQAIARFLTVDLQMFPPAKGNTAQISKCRKMVYVSPSKALIEERYADWSKCLAGLKLGIEIAVVTGDGDPADSYSDLASAHFILTTPEKWDSLTRRWTENFFLFASVKLFMVDEVHLLADESRGCCLEAIVCRMKAIQSVARQIQTSQEDLSRSRCDRSC